MTAQAMEYTAAATTAGIERPAMRTLIRAGVAPGLSSSARACAALIARGATRFDSA